MPTYAIGDVQGCYRSLEQLLEKIQFDQTKDTLWFTGDLVNRGPQSLETLRFVKNLPNHHRIVLGNHDLHLLAFAEGMHSGSSDDTLSPILTAPDCDELLHWLAQQPLLQWDETLRYLMVHAGLAPIWDLTMAKQLSHEVHIVLKDSEKRSAFLQAMYGNYPDHWDPALTGMDRLRCIINYFTRARFCYPDGRLVLDNKGTIAANSELIPWFKIPLCIQHRHRPIHIIFGHWAALSGITHVSTIHALDTGCVWGFSLSAMRLEDNVRFSVPCADF